MPNNIEKKTEEIKGKTGKLMEKYERDEKEKLDLLKRIKEEEHRQAMERQMKISKSISSFIKIFY